MSSALPNPLFLAQLRAALAALLADPAADSGAWAREAGRAVGALVGGAAVVAVSRDPRPNGPGSPADPVPGSDRSVVALDAVAASGARADVVCHLGSPADARRARALLDAISPALAAAASLHAGGRPAHTDPTPPAGTAAVARNTDQVLRTQFNLTARQLEVVALLLRGRRNADVAAALGTSPATARHHTERVLAKLGARSRAEVPGIVATRLAAATAAANAAALGVTAAAFGAVAAR